MRRLEGTASLTQSAEPSGESGLEDEPSKDFARDPTPTNSEPVAERGLNSLVCRERDAQQGWQREPVHPSNAQQGWQHEPVHPPKRMQGDFEI